MCAFECTSIGRWFAALAAALSLMSLAVPVGAATFEWTDPVNGAFKDPDNWTLTFGTGSPPPGAGDNANFNEAGIYTVTFAQDELSDLLSVSNGFVTLASDGTTRREYTLNTGSADVTIGSGGTLQVGTASNPIFLNLPNVTSDGGLSSSILTVTNGLVDVEGPNSRLDVLGKSIHSLGLGGTSGGLMVGDGATANIGTQGGTLAVGVSANAASQGDATVVGGGLLNTGHIEIATNTSGAIGSVNVSGAESQIVQTLPGANLTIGSASGGPGALQIFDGSFTSGTGNIELKATGSIDIAGGTFLANGPVTMSSGAMLTLDGGSLTANAGLDNSAGGTFDFTDGTLTVDGGTFNHSATDLTLDGAAAGDMPQLILTAGATATFGDDHDLVVAAGGAGSLTIEDGADVSNRHSFIGDLSTGVGTVMVDGAGSTWTLTENLIVGVRGSGTLTIQNQAVVSSNNVDLGNSSGSTGTATVDGAGSTWTMSSGLSVGFSGSGDLTIQNGGTVSSARGQLGREPTGIGQVKVTGAGSTWIHDTVFSLAIGSRGTGTLTIEEGGSVSSNDGIIGDAPGSTGTVTVTGVDALGNASTWTNGDDLIVGNSGTGTLMIENGGRVDNGDGFIGRSLDSIGAATVTGADSTWTNSGELNVGDADAGTLTIESGGTVSNTDGFIGRLAGSIGAVTVSGSDSLGNASTWTNSGDLSVGNDGAGTLMIEAGGNVTSGGDGTGFHNVSTIGASVGSTGSVTVSGDGSSWTYIGFLSVGQFGTGTLTIADGGFVSSDSESTIFPPSSTIGDADGATGTVTVTGDGSSWDSADDLVVGVFGTGTLTIEDGGSVSTRRGTISFVFTSEGTVTVTGDGSTWTNSNSLSVGGAGVGTLIISDGGRVSDDGAFIGPGPGSTGTVTVTGAGSEWENTTTLSVGGGPANRGGEGTLTIGPGGTVSVGQTLKIWDQGAVNLDGGSIMTGALENTDGGAFDFISGSLTIDDGLTIGNDPAGVFPASVRLDPDRILVTPATTTVAAFRTLTLDGGTLETGDLDIQGALQFNGGVLDLTGGAITGLPSLAVPTNGTLRATGTAGMPITAAAGSTIVATGNVMLGDATAVNGFGTAGTLAVGAHTVTLLDANAAVLDSLALATLGDGGGAAGTLEAANGLTLDFGGNITGHGALDTPNDPFKPLINNGDITGDSPTEPITLTGYVKGVGTLDNVTITGTDAPGFSAATVYRGSVNYDGTLQIEIGGTAPGSFDRIIHSGTAALGGSLDVSLLDGFLPGDGDAFEILTAAGGITGTFATELFPASTADLLWSVVYDENSVLLQVIAPALSGDYNGDGRVDAADYVLWRKTLGQMGTGLAADGNGDGEIDPADYGVWRANFGQVASGKSTGLAAATAAGAQAAVPEPSAFVVFIVGSMVSLIWRAGRSRP